MRTRTEINQEIDALTERRTALWRELSAGADEVKSAEITRLNTAIEALWDEARQVRNRMRFGDPTQIIARARAEERLEREYARVA